jgi:rhodanese-related sulfurtransferase
MKSVVTIAFAAALAAGVTLAAQQPPARQSAPAQQEAPAFKAKKLSRADFDTLLKAPARVLVVDVRRLEEVQSIGGFPVYLSVQAGDLQKQLAAIPKDRTIITVSNHASRAGRAADLLAENGFTVAGAIGAQDYEAEGGTLVKIAPREAAKAQ